ncbi:MAG: long-chain fatty acid--CoA ligase [Candidatus Eremiobacteraeota bacterium]|nr:long-chain fatty acid--CoA ligase [Candidatus Eremiobacteraeota bacterium]
MQSIGLDNATLPALIRSALSRSHADALVERRGHGWQSSSSEEVLKRAENLAAGLHDFGLQSGDRVALISPNRVDWVISDLGILLGGFVVVPIFPTQALDQVQYIIENSESKAILIDTPEAAARLHSIQAPLPPIFIFDAEDDRSLAAIERRGAAARERDPEIAARHEARIEPADLAVLIYTSGTTGQPKGVMLTHRNLTFTTESSFDYSFAYVTPEDPVLSVLPFSHIYEHMIMYGYLRAGVRYYICHNADELVRDLKMVRPVLMTSVPRIFERVLAGITGNAMREGGFRAKLVPWGLLVGRDYMHAKIGGRRVSLALRLKYSIARALVLKKIRPALGLDRLKFFVSGSAPLHLDTAMTLLGAGIAVIEGYGPTECSPVISVNRAQDNRYGTVGKPIPGVTVKIADDGEILVQGPNVMRGYYKNDAETAAVMQGGWYHTGDIGTLDADGYLRVTDRKKELFKTSGGKFVAPARVESAIKRSVYINQAMVFGESRPHPAALISPNWDLVRSELDLDRSITGADLAKRNDVHDFLADEVRRKTSDLAQFEQVRRIIVLPHELSVEGGELSPTLKVKRRVVEQRFADQIANLYEAPA